MPIHLSLKGQVAIVTGGASGIGRATVQLLREADATVIILDVSDDAGQQVADSTGAHYLHCDMGTTAAITKAYHHIIEQHTNIDILVNNVGIWIPGGDILTMSETDMDRMDAVNVQGPRHLTRLVMNGMKQHGDGGCVTFVASTQAHVIDGTPTIYNVEKNTILGMTKTFAIAGGPLGIRVNAVSPGAISTEGMGAAHAVGKTRIQAGNHKTPLGRRGRPEEVAQEIVNLCFATYTNGDNRIVDGGFSRVALPENLDPQPRQVTGDPDAEFLR
ncbi:MAG TPA: SDR family oxidoreductase [Candidatus Saccharimonadales bacterium]|nr:SDR family oxidoreductase [Candidatus Saccharimonadales bacterium]